jgi:predicted permease
MRHALRSLVRTPSFAAIAILTLAIGIGTNTAIFALVDELAFKPAQAAGADGVYYLSPIQIPDYDTIVANKPDGVAAIAAVELYGGGGLLQIPGRAAHVRGSRISGSYADVEQVRPQVGRWINDDDNVGGVIDRPVTSRGITAPSVIGQLGADVVVISDRIWREWFDADRSAVGRSVTLNHRTTRIVGVAPAGFETAIDVWAPFGRRRLLTREELEKQRVTKFPRNWEGPRPEPKQPTLSAILRTDAGVDTSVVTARLNTTVSGRTPSVNMPAAAMRLETRHGDDFLVKTGYIILGFAALIFVAACANLGNMLFARATEREGELAVRLSLGATRWGVFNLLFSEALLICAAASVAGLAFASGVLHLFTDAFPAFQLKYSKSVMLDLTIDWRITGYAVAAGAVAATVVGAGSLWRSSRVSLLARLAAASQAVVAKTEGRTLRTALVSVQVTAAVLLLIATGMLLENTSARLNSRVLYETGSMVTATLELPDSYDESRGQHFFDQLLTRVRSIDGVTAAGLTDALPGGESPSPRGGRLSIVAEPSALGRTPNRIDGRWIYVSPGLVEAIGLKITKGRDFRDTDQAGTDPVVMVGEATAKRLWPGEDPIGKQLYCCGATYRRTVVGVVPDPTESLEKPPALMIGEAMGDGDAGPGAFAYLPSAQHYHATMLVVLRADAPRSAIQPLRDAVVALDPTVPVFQAGPADATQFARTSSERAVRLLAGALGLIALGIAVFGVYAIVSYFVSRRSREFGLRLALGSTRGQIVKLVVDYAIHIILVGLLPGVLLASVGTRYFQNELRDLHPNGIMAWVVVPIIMLVAGVIAAYIPARRASRVDPYRSLKEL